MGTNQITLFYRALDPLVEFLAKSNVSPNVITATSLVFSIATGILFAVGLIELAILTMVLAGLCDVLDGHLARTTGQSSEAGAFFDSFIDRISDGLVLLGIAYYARDLPSTIAVAAGLSILASFSVSYARARAQTLGIEVTVGLMRRPQRFVFLLLMSLLFVGLNCMHMESLSLYMLEGSMWIFLLLTGATAVHRASFTMARLNER